MTMLLEEEDRTKLHKMAYFITQNRYPGLNDELAMQTGYSENTVKQILSMRAKAPHPVIIALAYQLCYDHAKPDPDFFPRLELSVHMPTHRDHIQDHPLYLERRKP